MKILNFSFISDNVYQWFKKLFINIFLRAACRRSYFVEQYARLYVSFCFSFPFSYFWEGGGCFASNSSIEDLSSLTRDQTHAPLFGSAES